MASFISIENTRFIFYTNFSGNPENDKYKSTLRRGNIVIPTEFQAQELMESGFNVKVTSPKDGDEEGFEPTFYVSVIANYKSKWPPKIYLVSGEATPVLLDENTISEIDNIRVQNVNAVLNPHQWEDKLTLYVKTMYVEQYIDDDPFAERYAKRNSPIPDDQDLPFNV